ncbi:MAG: methionyl-tRNA formyltransferase [Oscillospiraceae bacterium]|nr:methionyl-tRNA formyltransferase [Oscillospiraceae bacterium]
MRIVFMGTPAFAAGSLKRLLRDDLTVCAVYTQPDKARGRGNHISASPVKELAVEYGVPVFQPESLRTEEELRRIRDLQADLIVVVAYGKLLPDAFLQAAPLGAVNLHGSLLPKYRGAAPIQWAVLNGDKTTGVCTFYLCSEMDAGDLIYSEQTEIGEFETAGELFDRLEIIGAELLSRTVRDIGNGTAPRIPQDASQASWVGRLDRSLSPIDWSRSPRQIVKQICGLQPWPIATMELRGICCKVFAAEYSSSRTDARPGTILSAGNRGIEIACGSGEALYITELQAPGKKRMTAADYLRGHPLL